MAVKQIQQWFVGDFFAVKLADGSYAIGQVLDVPLPNAASCAFFDRRVDAPVPQQALELTFDDIIGAATVIPVHLDRGLWRVFSRGPVILPQQQWPNEATRSKRWIGSIIHTGAILESFLNAFYGLAPWNKYKDPHYLDRILVSPSKKPMNLVYESKGWRS